MFGEASQKYHHSVFVFLLDGFWEKKKVFTEYNKNQVKSKITLNSWEAISLIKQNKLIMCLLTFQRWSLEKPHISSDFKCY